jgi:hypothetical protein
MPAAVPSLGEIEATVDRMEARYRDSPLFATYQRLIQRFDHDLSDPRDRALSRAAVLMLLKFERDT